MKMIFTCDNCNTIFEHEEILERFPCPYCHRKVHDVISSDFSSIATKYTVRQATESEIAIYNDPAGYTPPDHSEDWKGFTHYCFYSAVEDFGLRLPDVEDMDAYFKTGEIRTKEVQEYLDAAQKSHEMMMRELIFYDELY